MKSFVLIGNKENANKFIEQVGKSVQLNNKGVAEINGQRVRLYYESNISKVINKQGGAIIIITGNDNKTPKSVEGSYAQLPNDFTSTYAQNNGESPIGFVRQVLRNQHVKNDKVHYALKMMFTLFGVKEQTVSKKRLMSMRLDTASQKTTMSA